MQAKSTPPLPNLSALNVRNGRILLRVDYNFGSGGTPSGSVAYRMLASIPTLRALLEAGARVGILTHRGRPQGRVVPSLSTEPLVPALSQMLGKRVGFVPDCIGRVAEQAMERLPPGEAVLMENTRFHLGEQLNQLPFAQALARCADGLVNDAFASAHRTQASTNALAGLLPAALGLHFLRELDTLDSWAAGKSERILLIGGQTVLNKMELLHTLLGQMQVMCMGGVMGNTFLAAKDMNLAFSNVDFGAIAQCRNFLAEAGVLGCRIHLPRDVAVAEKVNPSELIATRRPHELQGGEAAQDLGPLTIGVWQKVITEAPSLVWLGALGCHEHKTFRVATRTLAEAVLHRQRTNRKAFALLGGNGLLQALEADNLLHPLLEAGVHLSTGGSSLQQALAGRPLPGVQAVSGI